MGQPQTILILVVEGSIEVIAMQGDQLLYYIHTQESNSPVRVAIQFSSFRLLLSEQLNATVADVDVVLKDLSKFRMGELLYSRAVFVNFP